MKQSATIYSGLLNNLNYLITIGLEFVFLFFHTYTVIILLLLLIIIIIIMYFFFLKQTNKQTNFSCFYPVFLIELLSDVGLHFSISERDLFVTPMIHTRDAVLRQAGGTWSPQSDRLDIRHCASKVPVQLFGCHSAFFSPLNFFFF